MIEEIVQWFTPEEKMPEEGRDVIFINKNNGYFKFGQLYKAYNEERYIAYGDDALCRITAIRCWAYAPKGVT